MENNEEIMRHQDAAHKAHMDKLWANLSDTIDKGIDKIFGVVEEKNETPPSIEYIEDALDKVLDPNKAERELKIKERKENKEMVDSIEPLLSEVAESYSDLRAVLDQQNEKMRELAKPSKLSSKQYIYKEDTPTVKLMRNAIKKSLYGESKDGIVEDQETKASGTSATSIYIENVQPKPKKVVRKHDVEIDGIIDHLNKRKQYDHAILENVINKAKRQAINKVKNKGKVNQEPTEDTSHYLK